MQYLKLYFFCKALNYGIKNIISNPMFLERSVFQVDDFDKFELRISGKNQKNCLVIVLGAGFNEENHAFLAKIFSAVQFDLENDIMLYTWDQTDKTSLVQIMARLPFSTCILLGNLGESILLSVRLPVHRLDYFSYLHRANLHRRYLFHALR